MSRDELPFLPVARPNIGTLEREYILQAVESGWVSSVGPFVSRFESEFAGYVGSKQGVSTSNGTEALFIALTALGITCGDEVVVPSLTFVAAASVVVRTGAQPCFVDVDPHNWCIDPIAVELSITEKTKAIIAVHSYGHPADMTALARIAKKHDLYIVEDCAEAHGARINGQMVGSIGDIACFSFYGNKVITTGEGGMITTDSNELGDRCRFLKDHAMDRARPYYHSEIGFNCRMTNLQAALGCAQLHRLPDFLAERQKVLKWYTDAFSSREAIELNPKSVWAEPIVWMVCAVFVDRNVEWRDRCIEILRRNGVDSRPFFRPLSALPPYKRFRSVGRHGSNLPIAERLSSQGINLPTHVGMTQGDVDRVVTVVTEALRIQI